MKCENNGAKDIEMWFSLATILSIVALIIPNVNCGINPTARSEKARLINNFLNVDGIEEVLHNALMTRRFPTSATIENVKFKMVKLSTNVP